MFGLRNFSGSCWVNACLQAFFRIPEVQKRYNEDKAETDNKIDHNLQTIWKSGGQSGLQEFFEEARTVTMPAGRGIGDSHELWVSLCHKLPFFDELCRYKIAYKIECNNCKDLSVKEDTVIEFSVLNASSLGTAISKEVTPVIVNEWKCEKCQKFGCTKQFLIGSFPKVMTFYCFDFVKYSNSLVMNGFKYDLMAIVCYTGSHWMTMGRNMPAGTQPWMTLNDTHVSTNSIGKFPVVSSAKMLIYYRSNE